MNLYWKGDYVAAFQRLDQAIRDTEQSSQPNAKDLGNLLTTKAYGLMALGNPKQAENVLTRAMRVAEPAVGPNHPTLGRALVGLAACRLAQGRIIDAKTALQKSFSIVGTYYGSNHLAYALNAQIEAMMLLVEGKVSDARAVSDNVSRIIGKACGRDSYYYGMCLYFEGLLAAHTAHYTQAKGLYEASRACLERILGTNHVALMLVNTGLADLYQQLGEYRLAWPLMHQNLAILEGTLGRETPLVANALGSLGLLHYKLGNYADAELAFRICLDIREKHLGEDSAAFAVTINNLALPLMALGKDDAAGYWLESAARKLREATGNDSLPLAAVLLNQGVLAGQRQELQKAKRLHEEAIAMRSKILGQTHPLLAEALDSYSNLLRELGDWKAARSVAEKSHKIKVASFGELHPSFADSLETLGDIATHDRAFAEARRLYWATYLIRKELLGLAHPSVGYALMGFAKACSAQGDLSEAVEACSTVCSLHRGYMVRQFPRSTTGASLGLVSRMLGASGMLHSLCGLLDSNAPLVAAISGAHPLARTKGTLEEVQATQAALEADQNESVKTLHEKQKSIQAELRALEESKLPLADCLARQQELGAELGSLGKRLGDQILLVGDLIAERDVNLPRIAQELPVNTALVDIAHYRDYDHSAQTNNWREKRYAAYLTFPMSGDWTNQGVRRVDLGGAKPIDEAIAQLHQLILDKRIAPKRLEPVLRRLSALVYAPLAPHLSNVSHLLICPDGQLSRLPFEMLPIEIGLTNRYLIEEKTISYLSSAREIVRLASRVQGSKAKPRTSKPLVMGDPDFSCDLASKGGGQVAGLGAARTRSNRDDDTVAETFTPLAFRSRALTGFSFTPLPGSGQEAQAVSRLLGEDCILRLGATAREAELKAVVSPRVLHIATHGFFLSDQEFKATNSFRDSPFFSGPQAALRHLARQEGDWENPLIRCGIALAGANHATQITNALTEDGILTGLEASLLNLQGTELVILSACGSGAGDVKIGEGVMSLRRAFTIAGAESVLASHWNVADEATTRLMTDFMRRWHAGAPRVQAWREAQLSLLRSKDFASPYFWAAFTLTGQWR